MSEKRVTLQEYASEFYGEQVHLGWDNEATRFYVQFEDGSRQIIPPSEDSLFTLPKRAV